MDLQVVAQCAVEAAVFMIDGVAHPKRQDVPGQFGLDLLVEVGHGEHGKLLYGTRLSLFSKIY